MRQILAVGFASVVSLVSANDVVGARTECLDRCLSAERACHQVRAKDGQCDADCRQVCEEASCACRRACDVPCVSCKGGAL